jgi:hypothetical protein
MRFAAMVAELSSSETVKNLKLLLKNLKKTPSALKKVAKTSSKKIVKKTNHSK